MKQILMLLLCCLLLAGCREVPPAAETNAPEMSTAAPAETAPATTDAPVTEPVLLVFTLCRGNDNADGFLYEDTAVPEISCGTVLSALIEAGVLPDSVSINSFTSEGMQLNIDFNQAFYDYLCTMGTAGERMLIGSVVNTFLNAFEAESVFLTSEGEIMESGHVIYDFPIEAMT